MDSLVGLAVVKIRISRPDDAARHLDRGPRHRGTDGPSDGTRRNASRASHPALCAGRVRGRGPASGACPHLAVEGNPLALPRIRTLAALALLETGAVADALREAPRRWTGHVNRVNGWLLARALTARAAAWDGTGDARSALADRALAHALFEEIRVPDGHYRTAVPWRPEPHARRRRRRHQELPSDAGARCDLYLARPLRRRRGGRPGRLMTLIRSSAPRSGRRLSLRRRMRSCTLRSSGPGPSPSRSIISARVARKHTQCLLLSSAAMQGEHEQTDDMLVERMTCGQVRGAARHTRRSAPAAGSVQLRRSLRSDARDGVSRRAACRPCGLHVGQWLTAPQSQCFVVETTRARSASPRRSGVPWPASTRRRKREVSTTSSSKARTYPP